MGKIRRKFDIQFKIRVCQAIEAGTPVREICRDNQLQRAVIESWMQKYVSGALEAKAGTRQSELERENEKLKAKVGELTMHIDLLKKMGDWKKQPTSANSSIITSKDLDQFQKDVKPQALPSRAITTNRKRSR